MADNANNRTGFANLAAGEGRTHVGMAAFQFDPTVPAKNLPRNQAEARRIAFSTYPYRCCCICGLQLPTCLTIAHLDHNPGNNDPDNLALLCQTHHWMFDAGLYPIDAVRSLRTHWQLTKGIPSHKARMKDAGAKAALARKRSRSARKAWGTRRQGLAD